MASEARPDPVNAASQIAAFHIFAAPPYREPYVAA